MAKDNFTNKNIFELMEVPIENLKEFSIEEFTEEINGKRVHIHPFTESKCSDIKGNIYISATNVNVFVKKESDGHRIGIWGESTVNSQLYVNLSEDIIFGIYSYGKGKSYRVAFEGNSPDLLIIVVGGRVDRK
jgi:hypothetical protein